MIMKGGSLEPPFLLPWLRKRQNFVEFKNHSLSAFVRGLRKNLYENSSDLKPVIFFWLSFF